MNNKFAQYRTYYGNDIEIELYYNIEDNYITLKRHRLESTDPVTFEPKYGTETLLDRVLSISDLEKLQEVFNKIVPQVLKKTRVDALRQEIKDCQKLIDDIIKS